MWADRKFMSLSGLPPCGQGLWVYLLTGPQTGIIPGLFSAGRMAMAEMLGWEMEDFDRAFDEISENGMAKSDWKARLVWIPNAIFHNKPDNPSVVRAWRKAFDDLPECDLRDEAEAEIFGFLASLGESFFKAFKPASHASDGAPQGVPHSAPQGAAQQEQEQEQELLKPSDSHTFTRGEPLPRVHARKDSACSVFVEKPPDPVSTTAGEICKAIRREGIQSTNPSHPTLRALVDAGVDAEEFGEAAREAVQRGKASFAYVLGIVRKRREEAAALKLHKGALPPARASPAQENRLAAARAIFGTEIEGGKQGNGTGTGRIIDITPAAQSAVDRPDFPADAGSLRQPLPAPVGDRTASAPG
jgi:hypothetical protein